MAKIVKTVFTYTVLHPDYIKFDGDLRAAMAEAWDGHAVGLETSVKSEIMKTPKQVEKELLALGNDGAFFEDDVL